jgi:hypothetical protein
MRRYALALQLVVLLCCAAASGYLWRAALGTARTIRYVSAGSPYSPSWPAPSPPGKVALPRVLHTPSAQPSGAKAPASGASSELASGVVRPHGRSARTPVSGSGTTKPPSQSPPPKSSPPPPSPPTPPPSPPAPPSPPSPPPPSPPPPAAPVVRTVAEQGARPGWGHGDKNHVHTGPPAKKGKVPEAPAPAQPTQPPEPQTPASPSTGPGHGNGNGNGKK